MSSLPKQDEQAASPAEESSVSSLPEQDGQAASPLPDTRQDLRWVWAAMEPAERRERLDRLAEWVDWLVTTYELRKDIPPCWYEHSPALNRLTALFVGWVRVYVEAGEQQRDLALVEWHDALDRTVGKLSFGECVRMGEHLPEQRRPWATDDHFTAFGAGPPMTDAAYHPAPFYQLRPKPTR